MRSVSFLIIASVSLIKAWNSNQLPTEGQSPYSEMTIGSMSASRGQMCSVDSFQPCFTSLQSVDYAEVATKQELLSACRRFKESFKCADRHMKRCFGVTERNVFNHVVGGAKHFIAEVCVPGQVQEDFLRHAECYSNLSRETDPCSAVKKSIAFLFESIDMVDDPEEGLKKTCCTYRTYVQCKTDRVTRKCGPEAGSFVQKHLDKISDHLVHEHCASFDYSSEDCISSSRESFRTIQSKAQKTQAKLFIFALVQMLAIAFLKIQNILLW